MASGRSTAQIFADGDPEQLTLQGGLHIGDPVEVFSKGANSWVKGKVAEILDFNEVRIEYESGKEFCSKVLHLQSNNLRYNAETDSQTSSAEESHLEECDPGQPDVGAVDGRKVPQAEEPSFKKGDEVHYHRQRADVWVFATIEKVMLSEEDVLYELKYEAWDEPAEMKKCQVCEEELRNMQRFGFQRDAPAGRNGGSDRIDDESIKRARQDALAGRNGGSDRINGKPLWLRGGDPDDHIKALEEGDEVWFQRGNGDPVAAEIEVIHKQGGKITSVDLTYMGLDEKNVLKHMHKQGVTLKELAVAQHPRNQQSRINLKRTLRGLDGQGATSSKLNRTQLHAASRAGDLDLVRRLLLQRADPTVCKEDGSSALHAAAYHGHQDVLKLLVDQVGPAFDFSMHVNVKGETPLDIARERLRFCPSNQDALEVFTFLFGGNPSAQEKASRVMSTSNPRQIRTYNQGFVEAVVRCPLIGDRTEYVDIKACNVFEIAEGIEKEERRVMQFERPEYDDWSYWRASFDRGMRRHGVESSLSRRMSAKKMRQLLLEASNAKCKEDALGHCAIKLYTAATFLFKATNFAMRSREQAEDFQHLRPYAQLLNQAVKNYARQQPWTGIVHRVLPISGDMVEMYSKRSMGPEDDPERFFSWSGFISATAWVEECRIFQDLRKYGARQPCFVFIIEPDPSGGSVHPVDLRDMASFGAQDHELLYKAGQQFKVVKFEGPCTRKEFAEREEIKNFNPDKDDGKELYIVRLMAIDGFLSFTKDFFRDGGDIQACEDVLRRMMNQEGLESSSLLPYRHALARLLEAMGRYGEAEPMYRETLKALRKDLGPTHPDTLTSSNNLASLLKDMGRYGEAEPMFRETLKAQQKDLGPTHPHTLLSSNNFASLLQDMGRYGEAEPMYRETLKALRKDLGPTHPHTLSSSQNLALLLQAVGRYGEAEPMFRETLKALQKDMGPTHPHTLSSSHNLASLLQDMGRYGEAEPMFRETLKAQQRDLGPTHPHTLLSSNNFASLLTDIGRYGEAEPMFRETLKALQKDLGPTHPHTLLSSNNLASLLKDMGRYGEAEPMFREALKALRKDLGPTHPHTLSSSNNLASWLTAMGRYGEAEPMYRETLKARQKDLGPTHPDTLSSSNNLASLLTAMGRYGEAEPMFRETLKALRKDLGPTHPTTLIMEGNLASLLCEMPFVQVAGLESDSGKILNGQRGVVVAYYKDVDRYEVALPSKHVKLKPENFTRISIQRDDRVKVVGLESESGRHMNGQIGTVVDLVVSTGRLAVRMSEDNLVSLKMENSERLSES